MLLIHAGTEADEKYSSRFLSCFDAAVSDAARPDDGNFRSVLHDFMVSAANEVRAESLRGSKVPVDLPFPQWSWDGATC